uniref:Uncharacterized protein n=1 Tax=Ditylenchus dipsaci TaxID=166011 RepID=A0A915DFY6_9BILA
MRSRKCADNSETIREPRRVSNKDMLPMVTKVAAEVAIPNEAAAVVVVEVAEVAVVEVVEEGTPIKELVQLPNNSMISILTTKLIPSHHVKL